MGEKRSEEEIERRRDKIAKRMLNTPPKPRNSKPKGKKGKREEAVTPPRPI